MKLIFQIFIALLLLVFILPLIWFLLKELFWLFGFTISGIFVTFDMGWFLLAVFFIGLIIWMLSSD